MLDCQQRYLQKLLWITTAQLWARMISSAGYCICWFVDNSFTLGCIIINGMIFEKIKISYAGGLIMHPIGVGTCESIFISILLMNINNLN